MKVLITGAGGLVGQALVHTAPPHTVVRACRRAELDITNELQIENCVRLDRPDVIINAAVFLAADRAEHEAASARAVNTDGPRKLAVAARGVGARLVQISTSYVFDGSSSQPYKPGARTNPLSIYGITKRDGEDAVLKAHSERSIIVRTTWLHAAEGPSFVKTMLRSMLENGSVRAAADQVSTPTSAKYLAEAIWTILDMPNISGIYHWSDAGVASWYDIAIAIAEEGSAMGLVPAEVTVAPAISDETQPTARRPRYSVLDTTSLTSLGITPLHWRKRLRSVLKEITLQLTPSPVPEASEA